MGPKGSKKLPFEFSLFSRATKPAQKRPQPATGTSSIAARCWHHHASLSHEPRGHSHCRARPAWPNLHLVGAHRGHPQPQPDRCACVQCGRTCWAVAVERWARRGATRRRKGCFDPFVRYLTHLDLAFAPSALAACTVGAHLHAALRGTRGTGRVSRVVKKTCTFVAPRKITKTLKDLALRPRHPGGTTLESNT